MTNNEFNDLFFTTKVPCTTRLNITDENAWDVYSNASSCAALLDEAIYAVSTFVSIALNNDGDMPQEHLTSGVAFAIRDLSCMSNVCKRIETDARELVEKNRSAK